ncbi:nucleoside recognition domain-containing protein [Thermobrachium celere]|uniref:Spore maturation protein A n=1 Tax=Thermobrachium celere DSM 8682 TaxID=941824 RepID=R7RLZ0_9CLOT|nr:nucleoside recognition domain-containing protein [Thermobrachium celere]GFR34467.1 spore maturation protein [Thermobrachium celere]CDF57187.1 Spore maturation protein A [Thermobrachium celere DSM 8682]
MINLIWFFMIFIGIITSFLYNPIDFSTIIAQSAESTVKLCISLLGIMAIWSGIMKLCEKSGLIKIFYAVLKLPMKILFPKLEYKNERALYYIVMNLASNMLGLSNAATPFGIKAMEELQRINTNKDTASDYMVKFIIINSACIQLIPATVISIRANLGATSPSSIVIPTIITSAITLIIALVLEKVFRRWFI